MTDRKPDVSPSGGRISSPGTRSPFGGAFKLAILGGGQLGRMLIQSTISLDLQTAVLDPDEHAPCRTFCHEFTRGSLTDFATVYEFGKAADIVTIEIENVNVEALAKLEADGVRVRPQPRVIRTIQDKGDQKLFLHERGIPVPEFELVDSREELADSDWPFPVVQKLRRTGYDGRGVYKIMSPGELERALEGPSVLERFVDFEKEISVIVARSASGEMKSYPTVEMMFHPGKNLVEFLASPAGLDDRTEARAQALAMDVARALDIVGLAAVEMFVMKNGTILVNEVAPRPHNSGHHTIEANVTSQFEQHLRAILDLPLGSTAAKTPAVMVNILGEEGFEGLAVYRGIEEILALEGATVHLYGKRFTKPFRKMGHVTIVDRDRNAALAKARFVKDHLKVLA